MLLLGIETSCDETAAAVVRDGREVLSSIIHSQVPEHEAYGGVVPEIASRAHLDKLPGILERARVEAGIEWGALDAIAVTRGPGLASSLLIGVAAAKGLHLSIDRPVWGINHLEGHAASIFLDPAAPDPADVFPLLLLLVSGGHTSLVRMEGFGSYQLLGSTIDDAAGEALDKGAKLLGLGYPGGPLIEKAAAGGNPKAIRFPRGLSPNAPGKKLDPALRYSFSFSGLKTSLRYRLESTTHAEEDRLADLAASYQEAVVDALASRMEDAVNRLPPVKALACVGGVARNASLRARLDVLSTRCNLPLLLAPPAYCTDNAAMIAAAAGLGACREVNDFEIHPNLPLGQ